MLACIKQQAATAQTLVLRSQKQLLRSGGVVGQSGNVGGSSENSTAPVEHDFDSLFDELLSDESAKDSAAVAPMFVKQQFGERYSMDDLYAMA